MPGRLEACLSILVSIDAIVYVYSCVCYINGLVYSQLRQVCMLVKAYV